jgi:hypothetical protein
MFCCPQQVLKYKEMSQQPEGKEIEEPAFASDCQAGSHHLINRHAPALKKFNGTTPREEPEVRPVQDILLGVGPGTVQQQWEYHTVMADIGDTCYQAAA